MAQRERVGNLAQLQQVVSAYEAVDAEFGIKDLRWMVHHVPFVSDDLLTRLKDARLRRRDGGVPLGHPGRPTAPVGAPFRTIVDHGIKVGIHGDGVHIAPLNPWPHIHYATTGINSFGQQINPGQQITRPGGAPPVHAREQPGSCAWRTRSARSRPASSPTSLVLEQGLPRRPTSS